MEFDFDYNPYTRTRTKLITRFCMICDGPVSQFNGCYCLECKRKMVLNKYKKKNG